jgi:glycerophosphoryl diester phosphodiesterase
MEFMNCGHRGAMSVSPENTMASFALAAEQGANELELDLRVSADGVLVVIHDATVDRTTNGTGEVAAMTYAELRALDAGDGQQIPAFNEVVDGTDVRLQVEIKAPEAIDGLVAAIEQDPGLGQRVSPCCFTPEIVEELAERLPDCAAGLISKQASVGLLDQAEKIGARRVLFGWPGADQALVDDARERGLHVNVWPVNTPEQLRDAVALGVDGFTTDYPPLLFENGYTIQNGRLVRT